MYHAAWKTAIVAALFNRTTILEKTGDVLIYGVGLPIVLLLVTYYLSRFISRRTRGNLVSAGFQVNIAILLARALWIGVWAGAIALALSIYGIALTPLAAVIGVLGLAASLSLQQVLQNLVAGVYLLAERPFAIGDVVNVIGPTGLNHEGIVEDIQMRTTHLRSLDNERILVPNSAIFSGVITNRSAAGGYSFQVSMTFPRDVEPVDVDQKAVAVLGSIADVLNNPAPTLRVEAVGKEEWKGCLLFTTSTRAGKSDAVWALGRAFPDAAINDGLTIQ